MQMMNKKTAMTLAEILLVITILGVVASLTVPGLRKYSQRSQNAKLAQKGYFTLVSALDLATAESEVPIDNWDDNNVASFLLRDRFARYMNKAEDCSGSYDRSNSCFKGIKAYNSSSAESPTVRSLVFPDGMSVSGAGNDSGMLSMQSFIIDVNGPNEPNMEGVDMFVFDLAKFNENCGRDVAGVWKFCPRTAKTKQLVEDGWCINYW